MMIKQIIILGENRRNLTNLQDFMETDKSDASYDFTYSTFDSGDIMFNPPFNCISVEPIELGKPTPEMVVIIVTSTIDEASMLGDTIYKALVGNPDYVSSNIVLNIRKNVITLWKTVDSLTELKCAFLTK